LLFNCGVLLFNFGFESLYFVWVVLHLLSIQVFGGGR
jgi:hypothetical protein